MIFIVFFGFCQRSFIIILNLLFSLSCTRLFGSSFAPWQICRLKAVCDVAFSGIIKNFMNPTILLLLLFCSQLYMIRFWTFLTTIWVGSISIWLHNFFSLKLCTIIYIYIYIHLFLFLFLFFRKFVLQFFKTVFFFFRVQKIIIPCLCIFVVIKD